MDWGQRLKVGGKLLPKQCKQQGQDNADNDGGGDREVESELLFLDDDVTREFTDPRDLLADQEQNPDGNNKDSQENEHFSQSTETEHITRL